MPADDGLEIDQDLAFYGRLCAVQRAGWAVIGTILLAALCGLFGTGPFSEAVAGKDLGFQVKYSRFGRTRSPLTLRLSIGPGIGGGGELRVSLGRRFIENVEMKGITPPPDTALAGPDDVTYVFRRKSGDRPVALLFRYQSEAHGLLRTRVSVEGDGGGTLEIRQIYYP
jgi:hypothetical protein